MGFISLVITGFILLSIKDFIKDLVYYVSARLSDIGFGQKIYWRGDIFTVREIKFKYMVIADEDKVVRIPLRTYMSGNIVFPNPDKKPPTT